jgi:uncharacterized membrane protein
MIIVTLFNNPSHSAEERKIRTYLEKNKKKNPYQLIVIDITTDLSLLSEYEGQVPYLQVGPYHLAWPFTQQELQVSLQAASDRQAGLEVTENSIHSERVKRGKTYSNSDRFTLWFSRHYMLVFNILVGLYVGFAFLAPILMKAGARNPGRILYALYSPLCHQLAYRSWFLFGEQSFYPRELAGIAGVLTYTQATGFNEHDVLIAKRFVGDDLVGYKVALCERDIAIYLGILLFGIAFSIRRHRIKSLPWYFWITIGIFPLGLDGASQLPSLLSFLPDWLPLRESTPLLRTITGALFGITTAWYGYPLVEESVQDTRRIILHKRAIIDQVANHENETS